MLFKPSLHISITRLNPIEHHYMEGLRTKKSNGLFSKPWFLGKKMKKNITNLANKITVGVNMMWHHIALAKILHFSN